MHALQQELKAGQDSCPAAVHKTPMTTEQTIDRSSPDLLFFGFSEGCVLFRQGTRKIWALNRSAAFFWCLLDGPHSVEGLAQKAVDAFNIGYETALRDAEAVTDFFIRENLIGLTDPRPENVKKNPATFPQSGFTPDPAAARQFFNLSGHVLELACMEVSAAAQYGELMAHLACPAADSPEARILVLPEEGEDTWNIILNNEIVFADIAAEEILPHLMQLTFTLTAEALHDRLLFHGAVLAGDEGALLFPAEMGSGKTTLAALLAGNGFRYVSDELVVLDRETGRVLPCPLPMSVKPGSVPILANRYPELSSAPVFKRPDNKTVRYLLPPVHSLAETHESFSAGALVFPAYSPETGTALHAMDRVQALNLLAQTGSSDRPLTEKDIRTMIALVEHTPSYRLEYSDAEEAVAMLSEKGLANG